MFKKVLLILIVTIYAHSDEDWIPPEKALEKLMKGNERYVAGVTNFASRSDERRLRLIEQHNPFAVILGCSDSRGGPEIIFDQGIGDLFVVRVAGTVVGAIGLASIEYGAAFLNTSLIMVLGHQDCGAVKAVLEGKTKGIEPIAILIQPAIDEAREDKGNLLVNSIKDNVFHVIRVLEKSPLLASLIEQKKLKIVGGYYDFTSGKVELIKPL